MRRTVVPSIRPGVLAPMVLLMLLGLESARGAELWSYYDADEGPPVSSPDIRGLWNFWPHGGGNVAGIPNEFGTGRNSWQIRDDSTSVSNPLYRIGVNRVVTSWRLRSVARVLDEYRHGPNTGIQGVFNDRRFAVALGLDSAGSLIASLIQGDPDAPQPLTYTLEPPGAEAIDFHSLELVATSPTQATFVYDGVEIASWSGSQLIGAHPNSFEWGSVGGSTRGAGRFRSVFAELGPFVNELAGDFNNDGLVDIADFTLWRDATTSTPTNLAADANGDQHVDTLDFRIWRNQFGAGVGPLQDSPQVPEPAALWLAALCFVAFTLPGGVRHQ